MVQTDVMDRLAARVAAGDRLTDAELADLARADVLVLGMLAETSRRRAGLGVSYTRVHVIDLQKAVEVPQAADEVRVAGMPDSLDEATALVRRARHAAGPDRWVTAFSLADLLGPACAGWGEPPAVFRALVAAGLSDLAEIPSDRLDDLSAAVVAARAGGIPAQRVTVERPLGERKLEVIARVRDVNERLGGVALFAPLARRPATELPTTGYDDLRTVALARLALGHVVTPSRSIKIEVDWSLYGPKLAQVALVFGADHLDAVPATSDPALGPRRATVEDLERNIRAAGFEPAGVGRRPA
jgi:2-iminoacetate synthase ThiH